MTTTTLTTGTATNATDRTTTKLTLGTVAKGAGYGSGIVAVLNSVVFLFGNLGAPVRVVTGWSPNGQDLQIAYVLMASISWVILAAVALWVIERFRAGSFGPWAVLAASGALVSIPPVLRLDIDSGSKLTLAVMHTLVGVAAVAGQAIARRRAQVG